MRTKSGEIKVETKEEYIRNKTEDMIIEMLDTKFEETDREVFDMKLQATRTAMIHLRDREIMKRISQGQTIRVFNLISSNPEQLQRYIEVSMPEVIPKIS